MPTLRTLALVLCLAGLTGTLSLTSGCDSAQPGVSNKMGSYVARIKGEPDKVSEAAKAALEDLQFKFITVTSSKVDGYLTAKTAQNEDVTISINSDGPGVSKIDVRVGTFGDEAISLRIITGIQSKL